MQWRALLLLALALCCVGAPAQEHPCDGADCLQDDLRLNRANVADELSICVTPLLFAPTKWLDAAQAREYCREDACQRAVALMEQLPECTWTQPAGEGQSDMVAMAHQVMRDCRGSG